MTTVSQEAREAEVTQADRDAVDAFHRDSFRALFETTDWDCEDQLNRAHKLLCQAFARHRQSARGEVGRLREALRACRRAVSGGKDEPRRVVREIVDQALEEHDRATLPTPPEAA